MHFSKEEITRMVGNKIREMRTKKNKTIENVALDAGMEYTQLSRIERGKINTGVYHIYRIARSLGIKVHEIFYDLPPSEKRHEAKQNEQKKSSN